MPIFPIATITTANPDNVIAAAGTGPVSLGIAAPIDSLDNPVTITLDTLPGYGVLQFFDGSSWVDVTTPGTAVTTEELTSLRYTPPANGEHGGDTLIYTVTDGPAAAQGAIAFSVEVDSAGPALLYFTSFDGTGKPLPDLYAVDANGNVSGPIIGNANGDNSGIDGGLFQYAGNLYFNAFDSSGSEALFSLDPNGAVTEVADTSDPGQFFPANFGVNADFTEFAGRLYFRDGTGVGEINADGTSQFIDINGNNQAFNDNLNGGFVEFDHSLYFAANTPTTNGFSPDLIKLDSDGTVTEISTRAPANAAFGSNTGEDGGLFVFNNALYFNAFSDALGDTLFRLDAGSTTPVPVDPTGTVLLHLPTTAETSSAFHAFGANLYFNEFSSAVGDDTLFQLAPDGTLTPLTYFGEGLEGAGALGGYADFAGGTYFVANTSSTGMALFRLDADGTITDVYDDGGAGAFDANLVSGFAVFNGSLYFDAYSSTGDSLFKLDPNGMLTTVAVNGGGTTNAGVEGGFRQLGDSLYFTAFGANGYELASLNADGTVHVYDFNPGPGANGIVPGDGEALGLFPLTVLHGTGGTDVLAGGSFSEILDAGAGNDVLEGRGGNDVLIGDGGADIFKFDASGPANVDTITEYAFTFGGGDLLDLSALLDANFTPTSNISDFVRLVAVGQDLKVQVDTDGPANGQNWTDVAILDGSNTGAVDAATVFFAGADHTLVEPDLRNLRTVDLAGGGWAVTWSQTGDDDGTPDLNIYARVFDAQGHQIGSTFEVSDPNDMDDQNDLLTALPNGDFAVTWQSCDDEILTRVYDATGNEVSAGTQTVVSGANFPIPGQAITLNSGGYAVIWDQIDLPGAGGDNVYVATFNADGSPDSGPVLANSPGAHPDDLSTAIGPSDVAERNEIVRLDDGYAVTWLSSRDTGPSGGLEDSVFVRVFENDGNAVTAEIQANSTDGGVTSVDGGFFDTQPEIVALGGDNFGVFWESDSLSGTQQIFARVFNAGSYTAATPLRVDGNTDPTVLAETQHATGLTNGGFVALWGQYDTLDPNSDLYVQTYDSTGAIAAGSQFGGIKVNQVSGVVNLPDQVIALADGGFAVLFESIRDDGTGSGPDQDVFIRTFAADGSPTSGEVMVNTADSVVDAGEVMVALADGSFAVLWTRSASDELHQDVLLQRLSPTGALLGTPLLVDSTPFDNTNPNEQSGVAEFRTSLTSNQDLMVAAIDFITQDFNTVFPNTGFNYFFPLDLHVVPASGLAPNIPPSAPIDSNAAINSVTEGAAAGTPVGITASSTDLEDGTNLAYSLITNPGNFFQIDAASGVVTVSAAGAAGIDYESVPGHAYAISVQASDSQGGTNASNFSIAVGDAAPAAAPDNYSVTMNHALTVAAGSGVLANDADVNGGAITAVLNSGPTHSAAFALGSDGSFAYTPAASFVGSDSFTYHVDDGTLAGNVATVTLTVAPTQLDEGFHGDFDGNHIADLLVRGPDGTLTLLQSQTAGGQLTSSTNLGLVGTDWQIDGSADFNGDGKSDILWRDDDGTVALWQMNGAQLAINTSLGLVGNEWHIDGSANFNGDGKNDILWRNDSGAVALWQMNGSQIASNASLGSVGTEWHVVALADVGNDHRSDILWRNDNGTVALWQMNGTQVVSNTSFGVIGNDWHVVGAGDFNGDGNNDILWRDDDGTVAIWQMNGASIQSNQAIGLVGPEWRIEGTADFNGDGKTDILFQNDDGTLATWTMNGTHIASQQIAGDVNPATAPAVHHYDLV